MNQAPNSRFKFFPQLNNLENTKWLSSTSSFFLNVTDKHFNSENLQDTFLQAIAKESFLPIKEVFETFEFFERIRKSSKALLVADLCCGHGLLGLLFAIFERKVERVILIDKKEPESRQKLIKIAISVAPWIESKIDNRMAKITIDDDWIEPGASIVSAHACGSLSDLCISIAIKSGGPLAILPCCYPRSACAAPLSLQTALGLTTAFDIHRTYALEAADYRVRWAEIPREITPMNRIIYAQKKK
ncbi:hypothetical protein PQO03_04660 [Lentisphaera profundi]|uniref:Methyltransferase domain-containing protein n=1 Tax=Lentisphaera profundi TaxID=1658616 RepID=A0ABY7VWH6_9BACT|nr:methyltransferase [Lentisphaera profundi]WDE97242.1 hypothetical protein PQO03_04660 [Lentisphaera profundi]